MITVLKAGDARSCSDMKAFVMCNVFMHTADTTLTDSKGHFCRALPYKFYGAKDQATAGLRRCVHSGGKMLNA